MSEGKHTVYVGAGSWDAETGKIQVYDLDARTGAMQLVQELRAVGVAAYMARSSDGSRLYVADETKARLSTYAVSPGSGRLELLGQIEISGHPVYVALDASGRSLITCYFAEAKTEVFEVLPDGTLGASRTVCDSGRESHCTVFDPERRFLFVPTRGDGWISQYRFDEATGALAPNTPARVSEVPGAGPRHLAFNPDGRHAYLVNELNRTLSVYAFDPVAGTLTLAQGRVPTAPDGIEGGSGADVRVHPSGRHLYVSNRQGDRSTLAIFAIDPGTGRVSLCRHEPTRGRTPRNFALNAEGTVLIVGNRESDNAAVFRVTDAGGTLVHLGTHAVAPGPFFIGIY